MNAVNRVWAAVGIYVKAMSFLAALFCVFTLSTPQASAANNALTPTQVGAIANLLTSLNVDQATIAKVQGDLVASPSYAGAVSLCNGNTGTCAPAAGSSAAPTASPQPFGFFGFVATSTTVGSSTIPILIPLPVMPAPTPTNPGNSPAPKNPPTVAGAPTCTLVAGQTSLGKNGGDVTLYWTSKNATSVSAQGGGTNNKLTGSVTLSVKETTQFVKKVYGPGGSASCSATVTVKGDPSPDTKMVWNVLPSLMNTINEMQVGAVVVGETLGLVEPASQ